MSKEQCWKTRTHQIFYAIPMGHFATAEEVLRGFSSTWALNDELCLCTLCDLGYVERENKDVVKYKRKLYQLPEESPIPATGLTYTVVEFVNQRIESELAKLNEQIIAIRKRVDATEQRIAELERKRVDPASKDKPHNPKCLCKDCHEDKQPATLPTFVDVETIKFGKWNDTVESVLENHTTVYADAVLPLLANSRLDQQRIRMLVDGVKTITEFWNPHGMAALNALIQRAGCDKI